MNEKFKVEITEKNLLQRAKGNLEISFVEAQGETTLAKLYQSGSLRVLIPKSFSRSKEAIIINTGGGIIGGDKFSFSINSEKNTETWITTQAAEKIYKSTDDLSRVEIDINLGENASLFWCPQETILFDKSKLSRNMNISVKKSVLENFIKTIVESRSDGNSYADMTGTMFDIDYDDEPIKPKSYMASQFVDELIQHLRHLSGCGLALKIICFKHSAADMAEPIRQCLSLRSTEKRDGITKATSLCPAHSLTIF